MSETEAPAVTIEDALAAPQMVAVGLYMTDRAYGGPEEGGWYYDCGELIEDPDIYAELGAMPATFRCHADAGIFMRGLQDKIDKMNEGRPSTGHSNSRGRYELVSFEGVAFPKHFPDRRPIYE
jgi:hypothetical protein